MYNFEFNLFILYNIIIKIKLTTYCIMYNLFTDAW